MDFLNRASIHHVVTISANELYNRLVTHVDNANSLAADTKEFAQEVAKKDSVGGVLSYAQAKVTARFDLIKTLGAASVIFVVIADFLVQVAGQAQVFGESQRSVLLQFLRFPVLVYAGHIVNGYWDLIGDTFNSSTKANQVLADTVDRSEVRMFALIGSNPPGRPTMNALGAMEAIFLLVIGALIAWCVLNMLYGAFSSPAPLSISTPFSLSR
ncbi:MAG: hypothetical protein H0V78_10355 [Burkholderiales bacterium]|nr:hypothetical protein [Burkholderiales bacterium]